MADVLVRPGESATDGDGHSHQPALSYGIGGPPWGWRLGSTVTGRRGLPALMVRHSWLAPMAVLFCMLASVGWVLSHDPADTQPDPFGQCLFRSLTGLDCPGCGGTRMVWYLLHGQIVQAARFHLFALVSIPIVVYAYVAWAAKRMFGWRIPTWRPGNRFWIGFAVVGILYYLVVRNLPFEPFLYFRV
ncbi:DUF2752 domain-containing protein [Fodinicola feengrottensis]|uniref:DUF2752 domain-containing protein n=1 Tax=Fodinicola feengrottensis TaxID=435914 RepID=UPI00244286DC|nr:DUF2752 domain-containing protein [Fodinicola feengrottensis]